MEIIITGRIPSKKNSKTIVCRGRFPLVLPSNKYLAWHKEASQQIAKLVPEKPIEKCEMIFTFFAPDLRKTDLTNKAESIADLLVDLGFLVDDNWFILGDLHLKYGGLDRENPRVEINIIEL